MKLLLDNGQLIETTWAEFSNDNSEHPTLLAEIKTALETKGVYNGGGGAEPQYKIMRLVNGKTNIK